MARSRRYLPVLLAVALALAAISLGVFLQPDDEPPQVDTFLGYDGSGRGSDQGPLALELDKDGQPAVHAAPDVEPGGEPTVEAAHLTLKFQDFSGSPKAGLNMKLVSAAGETDVTTGSDGCMGIAPEHASYLTLTLLDEDLSFRRLSTFTKDISLSERSLREEPTIIVYQMLSYSLEVRYEDGLPWQGKLMLDEDTSIGGAWQTVHLEDGLVAGFQVPAGAKAYASAQSLRAEYTATAQSWIGGEADPALPIVLTLKRDPEAFAALLLIDLTGFEPDETVMVTVHDLRTDCCMGEGKAAGGEIYVVGSYLAGSYTVCASSRRQGWHSGTLQLKAVETRLLTPDLKACGSIAAKVTGEDGEVLPDARLFIRQGVFPRWTSWLKDPAGWSYDGVRCSVDESGNCELFGVVPGPVEIEVAGRRHESFTGTYDLAPGQRLDLGEIRLEPAKGSIQVQLSNFDANTEYSAQLYQTGGSSFDEPLVFNASGYLEMRAVPLRAYTLIIRPKGGGVATFRKVSLTPASPTASIDVEMPR
jgi:hypothetical protein